MCHASLHNKANAAQPGSRSWPPTDTTSSSSAPVREAVRSPIDWRPQASEYSYWSAAISCRARSKIGTLRRSFSNRNTKPRRPGTNGRPFQPGIHYYVGGNTKFCGAVLFRLRKEDFGEIRHHGGISPAWPLGYEDFE